MPPADNKGFWWQAKAGEVHSFVFDHVRGLEEDQKWIHEMNLRHAHLYGNRDLIGRGKRARTSYTTHGSTTTAVSENVIQSVIDTAMSLIAKNRPKATFLTDGGEWSEQRRAKKLDKFMLGVFQSTDIYEQMVMVFRDACVFGTGALKLVQEDDTICAERVLIDELVVDEHECRSAPPRQLHQRKFVHREVLKALFPKYETEIEGDSQGDDRAWTSFRKVDPMQVPVIESWYLNSGGKAKDWRHSIAIRSATLHDSDRDSDADLWDGDEFPFLFYKWSEPLCGFYGQGLAEQLAGIQLRIHELNHTITRAQDLMARPKIMAPISSKISPNKFTNEIADILYFRGAVPPVFMTPPAVSPEIYQYKELLKRSAFEFAGISQLSAQSMKPAGLESAVAMREFNDIETQRFSIQAQRYEGLFIRAAKMMVGMAKKIYSEKGSFRSVFTAKNVIEEIDWAEVDMDTDRFTIKVEASSILSRTPAGRLQSVIELANSGLIETDEARRLLDHPDIERSQSLLNASIENIERTIEMLLDGTWVSPEPFQDLQLGLRMVQQAMLKAQDDGAPDTILELLRRWLEQADFILKGPEPAEQGPGAPPVLGGTAAPAGMGAGAPVPAVAPPPAAVGQTAL